MANQRISIAFSSSGYTYDPDNPTIQTEELSFMLKNFLAGVSATLNIPDNADADSILSRTVSNLTSLNETQNRFRNGMDEIAEVTSKIADLVLLFAGQEITVGDPPQQANLEIPSISGEVSLDAEILALVKQLRNAAFGLDSLLPDLEITATPESVRHTEAIEDVAAASGVSMDSPGMSIIRVPVIE